MSELLPTYLGGESQQILYSGEDQRVSELFEQRRALDARIENDKDRFPGVMNVLTGAAWGYSGPWGMDSRGSEYYEPRLFFMKDEDGAFQYGQQDPPPYLKEYQETRQSLYLEQFSEAVETAEFDSLVSFICELKDPLLADNFMKSMAEKKKDYPDIVFGAPRVLVDDLIDSDNDRVERLDRALETFAKNKRDEEYLDKMKDCGPLTWGILKGLMKTNLGLGRYINKYITEPLEETCSLPALEFQLLPEFIRQEISTSPRSVKHVGARFR